MALKKWDLTIIQPDNVKLSVDGLELRSTNIQKVRSSSIGQLYLSSYNTLGSGLSTEADIKMKKTQLLLSFKRELLTECPQAIITQNVLSAMRKGQRNSRCLVYLNDLLWPLD